MMIRKNSLKLITIIFSEGLGWIFFEIKNRSSLMSLFHPRKKFLHEKVVVAPIALHFFKEIKKILIGNIPESDHSDFLCRGFHGNCVFKC